MHSKLHVLLMVLALLTATLVVIGGAARAAPPTPTTLAGGPAEIVWESIQSGALDGTTYDDLYWGGNGTSRPELLDIDADGDLDLFLGGENGHEARFHLFRNDGSAAAAEWSHVSESYFAGAGWGSRSSCGDLDGDGDLDCVLAGDNDQGFRYYENTGSAGAPAWALQSQDLLGNGESGSQTLADIDGDGDLDLFYGYAYETSNGGTSGALAFYEKTGSGWTHVSDTYASITFLRQPHPTFADIDNDGDLDLFLGHGPQVIFYRNDGDANTPSWTHVTDSYGGIELPWFYLNFQVTFGDLDGDLDLDMLVGNDSGWVTAYENTGSANSASWSLWDDSLLPLDLGPLANPAVGDLDADGDQDLLLGMADGVNGANLVYLRNDGTPAAPAWSHVSDNFGGMGFMGGVMYPTLVDIDNDADLDCFIGAGPFFGTPGGSLRYYENAGTTISPTWTLISETYLTIDEPGKRVVPTFADIDADGDQDLFVSLEGQHRFYRNDGNATTPSWTHVTETYAGMLGNALAFSDVDGDGDLDAFTDQGFYRNDGDAADALWSQAITPEGMAWNGGLPVLADLLDADGRPDTLFGVRGGVHLYRNLGDLPPQVASTAPAEHGLRAGAVVATFDNIMDPSTVISSNVSVVGSVSGAVAGSLFYEPTSQQLIYLPEGKFAEGETVEVTLKAAITDAAGNGLDGDGDGIAEGSPADDYTWSFTIKERSHLVISAEFEPETLYLYDAESSGQLVLQAIYQGPIGNRSYGYQPVILRKLPGIADGDAVINPVTVNTGDQVVDTHNDVVTLTVGTEVRPAGCRSTGCAVVFDGTPLQMDQLAATFELLPDLQWSDGEPLTADDSVYSYEIHRAEPYLNPPMFEFPPDALARTASYVALDELRTRWTALPGYIDSRFNLVFWHPLPRHAWEGQGLTPADLHTAPESTQSPLGWGPYSVEAWEPGVAITLTANPYYAGYPELPKIDTLVFRFADDSADALARVLAGEADATWSIGGLPDKLLALDGYGALNAHVVAGTVWEHGDFAIDVVAGYSRPDYFEDRALRQAVAHCLDREAMADAVTAGYGQVLHTYIPAEHPLYPGDEKLTLYPHTVLSGTQLLEGLGWTDTDGDGIRECNGCTTAGAAEGEKLTFKWQSSDAPLRITYMQIAQANLSACGIDLQIQALPITELFANGPEGPLFGRHFDIGSFAWISDYEPSCDLYTSDQIPSTANGWSGLNISGFSNAAYDTACTTALTSLPGTAAYVNNHYEAMRILSEEAPIVPLFSRIETAAAHPRLTGLRLDPTSRTPLDNVETWEFLVDGLSPQGTVRIGDGSPVQVERSTTLHLTAQDLGGGSVSQMLLRERAWIGQQWRVVAETGWIPFTASYAWELDPTPGAHYVSAYFMDDSGNASSLPARAFVNLTPGNSGIARGEAAVYRMTMRAGETLTATLSTLSGDADLYLWAHGNEGSPDAYSDLDGTREDQIVITGTVAGDYHVEVRGYAEESTYALAFDTASGAATRVSTEAASLALAKSVPSEPATTDAPDDTPAEAPGGLPAAAEVRAPLLTLDAGGESVQLTAELWDQKGENVADGTVVTFTTSLGSFGISGSDASTATTASGLVRVTLRSGTETGAAQVTARAGEAAASLTINFRWPYTIYLPLTLRP